MQKHPGLLVTIGLATAGVLLFAQTRSQSDSNFVPVQTIVTVEARHDHDKAVPSLKQEDVMVYERRERLKVTELVPFEDNNAGLDLFILLDDASSASLGSQLGDLRQFIETQPVTTAIGIGYMRNGTYDMTQSLTTDRAHAAHSLRIPLSSAGVMASPYLSLSDLIKKWPGNSARREVLMVTSGMDSPGGFGPTNPYLEIAIDDAQRHGIVVYAPPAGHAGHSFFRLNWAQSHLAQVSEETGGESYMLGLGPLVSFAPYLGEISARLAHQYRVTFLIKPEKKSGFRSVRFVTETPDAELLGASRIYVPAEQVRQ
jgi:hypothetical protein